MCAQARSNPADSLSHHRWLTRERSPEERHDRRKAEFHRNLREEEAFDEKKMRKRASSRERTEKHMKMESKRVESRESSRERREKESKTKSKRAEFSDDDKDVSPSVRTSMKQQSSTREKQRYASASSSKSSSESRRSSEDLKTSKRSLEDDEYGKKTRKSEDDKQESNAVEYRVKAEPREEFEEGFDAAEKEMKLKNELSEDEEDNFQKKGEIFSKRKSLDRNEGSSHRFSVLDQEVKRERSKSSEFDEKKTRKSRENEHSGSQNWRYREDRFSRDEAGRGYSNAHLKTTSKRGGRDASQASKNAHGRAYSLHKHDIRASSSRYREERTSEEERREGLRYRERPPNQSARRGSSRDYLRREDYRTREQRDQSRQRRSDSRTHKRRFEDDRSGYVDGGRRNPQKSPKNHEKIAFSASRRSLSSRSEDLRVEPSAHTHTAGSKRRLSVSRSHSMEDFPHKHYRKAVEVSHAAARRDNAFEGGREDYHQLPDDFSTVGAPREAAKYGSSATTHTELEPSREKRVKSLRHAQPSRSESSESTREKKRKAIDSDSSKLRNGSSRFEAASRRSDKSQSGGREDHLLRHLHRSEDVKIKQEDEEKEENNGISKKTRFPERSYREKSRVEDAKIKEEEGVSLHTHRSYEENKGRSSVKHTSRHSRRRYVSESDEGSDTRVEVSGKHESRMHRRGKDPSRSRKSRHERRKRIETPSSSESETNTDSSSSSSSDNKDRSRRHNVSSSRRKSLINSEKRGEKRQKEEEAKQNSEDDLQEYIEKKIQKVTVESLGRTGGVYIPPFKLARLQAEITDKTSVEYQRQSWEALKRSLNGLVNKVNVSNIPVLVQELFQENLIKGRGLLARAIIRAQMASPGFTHIYAALLAVINSKIPEIGELIVKRVLLQFRRSYRRNDKLVCLACVKFIAHMVNQKIVHELMALQLAALLLEKATNDSVEVAVGFITDVGQVLSDLSKRGFDAIFERLRSILQEGESDKKTQYTIERLWNYRRSNFKEFPGVIPDLDLVEEDDQITHEIDLLDENIKGEEMLNVFTPSPPEVFEEENKKWQQLSREILGLDSDAGEDASSEDSEDGDEEDDDLEKDAENSQETTQIHDFTEQDSINLRKAIYLTIMSSVNFEECVHKLLKLNIQVGQEIEVCTMLIDCCAMERSFQRFFALQAERLARVKPNYAECLADCFKRQYSTVHRLETNNLRNTAKFFALLFYTDALPWSLFEIIKLTEEHTTSSGRIFIKTLFQELSENMGIEKLNDRLQESSLAPYLTGLFPTDHPRNIRFSINFFTAIGLGGLTDNLRELLQNLQSSTTQKLSDQEDDSEDSSDSDDRS